MLSDRSYMREEYQRPSTSVVTWILCALAASYSIQLVSAYVNSTSYADMLKFSGAALQSWRIWTFLTYPLLPAGPVHLLANGLVFFLLGRELQSLTGPRRFLGLCAALALAGALAWLGVHAIVPTEFPLFGFTPICAGLFVLFACIYAEREITFFAFFVIPVTLRPKMVMWVFLAVDAIGLIYGEMAGGRLIRGVPYSAHLGGMLAGWLYYRFFHARNGWDRASDVSISLPAWLRRKKASDTGAQFKVNLQPRANLRAEVDRILDKINTSGFGALTEEEKRILDEAKDLLSRR